MHIPAKYLRRFHLTMIFAWIVLLVPSILWWKNSILWVVFMSDYALIGAHFAAWQGTRAEENGQDTK